MLPRHLLVTFGLLAACAPDPSEDIGSGEQNLSPFQVGDVSAVTLPIAEVSGLGHRRVASGNQFLAIGDASTTLVSFNVTAGNVSGVTSTDLSSLFGASASQWEAVTGDSDGRVFVLTESTNMITVIDRDLRRIVHKIKLVIPADHPLADAWEADENSRGEGMVLLANGHIIVAKEKNPSALVEFAPRGQEPEGYRADLALVDQPFSLPSGASSEMVATKHWLLKDRDARWLGDVSDVAIDNENRLLLLSDQGRAIARIERTLDPFEAKIDIKAIWSLPHHVEKPEGLAFAGGEPFVAIDGKNTSRDCLFGLEALP